MGPSPACSAATARCTVTVDLPEPPFWFATTMVFIRKAPLFLRGGAEVGNHHGCAGATRLIRTYDGHTQQSYKNSRFQESENFLSTYYGTLIGSRALVVYVDVDGSSAANNRP